MSTVIRLARTGTTKRPAYRMVVIDKARANKGGIIENLGASLPQGKEPLAFKLAEDRTLDWLKKGALPSATAKRILERSGIWKKFRP